MSLAGGTIVAVIVRTGMTFRENTRILGLMREHAVTDALTSLGNRRRLVAELGGVLAAGPAAEPRLLAIYDLDGFKSYNDTFGHPAGDALLARLASSLQSVVAPFGHAYRLGGDEFCLVADVPPIDADAFLDETVTALSEAGDGFTVTTSFGAVFLPDEATTPSDALRLADERLYVHKRERSGRPAPHEVLLEALYGRSPDLRAHVEDVVASAAAVGAALGLSGVDLEELRLAARIIAVCDAFSAMTSVPPYRLPLRRDRALHELRRCAGTQLDQDVVDAVCTVEQLSANEPRSATAA